MSSDEDAILEKLDRFSALVFARDPAVVDELWGEGDFVLHGSEQNETATSREELEALFQRQFAKPYRISWLWDSRAVTRHGSDLAWVSAEAQLEVTYPERTRRVPYRFVCIFQKRGERWAWRLFSGSEPAAPPSSA